MSEYNSRSFDPEVEIVLEQNAIEIDQDSSHTRTRTRTQTRATRLARSPLRNSQPQPQPQQYAQSDSFRRSKSPRRGNMTRGHPMSGGITPPATRDNTPHETNSEQFFLHGFDRHRFNGVSGSRSPSTSSRRRQQRNPLQPPPPSPPVVNIPDSPPQSPQYTGIETQSGNCAVGKLDFSLQTDSLNTPVASVEKATRQMMEERDTQVAMAMEIEVNRSMNFDMDMEIPKGIETDFKDSEPRASSKSNLSPPPPEIHKDGLFVNAPPSPPPPSPTPSSSTKQGPVVGLSETSELLVSDITMIGGKRLGPCSIQFHETSFKLSMSISKEKRVEGCIEYAALLDFSTHRDSSNSGYHIVRLQSKALTAMNSLFRVLSVNNGGTVSPSTTTPTEPVIEIVEGLDESADLERSTKRQRLHSSSGEKKIMDLSQLPSWLFEYNENGQIKLPTVLFFFHDELAIGQCMSASTFHPALDRVMKKIPTQQAWEYTKLLEHNNSNGVGRFYADVQGRNCSSKTNVSTSASKSKPRPTQSEKKDTNNDPSSTGAVPSAESTTGGIKSFFRTLASTPSSSNTGTVPSVDKSKKENSSSSTSAKLSSAPSSSNSSKSKKNNRESRTVLVYPFLQEKKGINAFQNGKLTITNGDCHRLQPGEFLNDTIIDFYLRFLWRELPADLQQRIYFYSTHFYTHLTIPTASAQRRKKRRSELEEKELVMLSAEEAKEETRNDHDDQYEKVKRWTRGQNIFHTDFLFIPINQTLHWSMAVVCNAEKFFKTHSSKDGEGKKSKTEGKECGDADEGADADESTSEEDAASDSHRPSEGDTRRPPSPEGEDGVGKSQPSSISRLSSWHGRTRTSSGAIRKPKLGEHNLSAAAFDVEPSPVPSPIRKSRRLTRELRKSNEKQFKHIVSGDKQPCILLLDSLGTHPKEEVVQSIWGYLSCAWKDEFGHARTFDQSTFPAVVPKVPIQQNGVDCGVFLLLNTLLFLRQKQRVGVMGSDLQKNLSTCFTRTTFQQENVLEFREYLHQLIYSLKSLATQQRDEKELVLELPSFEPM